MPRTWFSWTDSVLLGSNRLFIVSEMTVPGLRHAKQLVAAISERLGDGPQAAGDRQSLRAAPCSRPGCAAPTSSRRSGDAFAGTIPNNYSLVREAIDRGVPLDEVKRRQQDHRADQEAGAAQRADKPAEAPAVPLLKKLKLSRWRR